MIFESYDGTPGLIGLIVPENLEQFGTLLLPEVRDAIAAGESVTAIGWTVSAVAVGALAGVAERGWFEVLSFYVAPEYRGQGGGTFLLETMESLLEDLGLSIRISFVSIGSEHDELAGFRGHRGFAPAEHVGYGMYAVSLVEVAGIHMLKKPGKVKTRAFAEIDPFMLKRVGKEADVKMLPLPEGGFSSETIDRDASRFCGGESGFAFIVMEKDEDGALILSVLVNESDNIWKLNALLADALAVVVKKYPPETKLYIPIVNETSEKLVRYLLPGAKQTKRTYEKEL